MKRRYLYPALIVIAVFALYARTLPYPFQFDDIITITDNPVTKNLYYMTATESEITRAGADPVFFHHYRVRAIPYLSFWANYQIGGFGNMALWRAVNIALHAAMSALVYAFVVLLFRMPRMRDSIDERRAGLIALWSGLIFSVHPLMTETVIYITGRVGELAAVFYLASIVMYLRWRTGGGRLWLRASLLSGALSMFSKETGFTLPLMVVLIELIFIGSEKGKRLASLKAAAPHLCLLAVIPLAKIYVFMQSGQTNPVDALMLGSRLHSEVPRGEYLLTQTTVVIRYLWLLLFPVGQCVDYDYPLFRSLLSGAVLFSIAIHAGLIYFCGIRMVLRSEMHPALRLVGFGVLGFYLALAMESSVFPIIVLIAEYRTYLPMAFIVPALVAGAHVYADRSQQAAKILHMMLLLVVITLTFLALARQSVWSSDVKLWSSVLRLYPGNQRAAIYLGNALIARGNTEAGIRAFKTVLKVNPQNKRALYNLGVQYFNYKEYPTAIEYLERALAVDPKYKEALYELGLSLQSSEQYAEAIKYFESALGEEQHWPDAMNNIGICYAMLGDRPKAFEWIKKALDEKPDYVEALSNLALIYEETGDMKAAIAQYEQALKYIPDDINLMMTLGGLHYKIGNRDIALSYYEKVLNLDPGNRNALRLQGEISLH